MAPWSHKPGADHAAISRTPVSAGGVSVRTLGLALDLIAFARESVHAEVRRTALTSFLNVGARVSVWL